MSRSIELAQERRAMMEEVYLRSGSIEAAARELAASFYNENPDYFISREIFEGVYRQMVRHIAKVLEGQT